MILEQKFKQKDIQIIGEVDDRIEMGVDVDNITHLMVILSSNLYQNSIGSIIREYASNAIDANVEAGVDEPIIVRLKKDNSNNYNFEVQDFGAGLDDKDFRNIISKYGKSTKQDKENQLGFFGLGCKSGFSYSDSFYYTCVKNGMKRKYFLYKSNTGFTIDLLLEELTKERNGVCFSIPVKSYDHPRFVLEIKSQLAYFDNVYFDIDGAHSSTINADFKIHKDKDFQFSSLNNFSEMHLTLGRVNYPIDWKILGINRITIPIALTFDLNSGLFPIPNRENLVWNNATKDIVLNKIKKVATYLVDKYNQDLQSYDTLLKAWEYINTHTYEVKVGDQTLCINSLTNLSSSVIKSPEIKNLKYIPAKLLRNNFQELIAGYRIVANYYNNKFTKSKHTSLSILLGKKNALLDKDVKISGYFRDYLKTKGINTFVKYDESVEDTYTEKYYENLLDLNNYDKKLKNDVIKEYNFFKKQFVSELIQDFTKEHLSPEFEKFKKDNKVIVSRSYVSKRIVKDKDDIVIAYSYKIQNREGYAFGKKACKLSDLYKNNFMTIVVDDTFDVQSYAKNFSLQKLKFAKISEKNYEKIKKLKLHNFMKFKDLEKTRSFQRIATSLRIKKVLITWESLVRGKVNIVKECLKKQSNLSNELERYMNKNSNYYADKIGLEILNIAEAGNLWDLSIIDKVRNFEKTIDEFSFITYLRTPLTTDESKDYQNLISSIMLMKKVKFDTYKDLKLEKI